MPKLKNGKLDVAVFYNGVPYIENMDETVVNQMVKMFVDSVLDQRNPVEKDTNLLNRIEHKEVK